MGTGEQGKGGPRAQRAAGATGARDAATADGRPHGRFLAHDAGELVGVSGTTIGQWARWGYIDSSQRAREPRVYALEDVAEAAVVAWLLGHGVGHPEIRRAIERLDERGRWPLGGAPLAVTRFEGRAHVALREPDGVYVLTRRGWQLTAAPPPLEPVAPRVLPPRRPTEESPPR